MSNSTKKKGIAKKKKKKKFPVKRSPSSRMTLEELKSVFNRWLYLEDDTVVDLVLACVVANQLSGKPLWMYLVGEAGSGKTALLEQFVRKAQEAHPELIMTHGNCNAQTHLQGSLIP